MLSEKLTALSRWFDTVLDGTAEFTADGVVEFGRDLGRAEGLAMRLEADVALRTACPADRQMANNVVLVVMALRDAFGRFRRGRAGFPLAAAREFSVALANAAENAADLERRGTPPPIRQPLPVRRANVVAFPLGRRAPAHAETGGAA